MRLQLAESFGPVLVNRARACTLRESIEQALETGEDVVVDLGGVTALSPSVVDELFAKTMQSGHKGQLAFENVPATIEPLIRFVRAGRPGASVAA
jgi:anti-anti-sigma regulatory factor